MHTAVPLPEDQPLPSRRCCSFVLLLIRRIAHQATQINAGLRGTGRSGEGFPMSEGYTIDGADDIAGIVVRLQGERGFRCVRR